MQAFNMMITAEDDNRLISGNRSDNICSVLMFAALVCTLAQSKFTFTIVDACWLSS